MADPSERPDLRPRDVLDFWFGAGPEKWFAHDPAFDAEINARFGRAVAMARSNRFDGWAASAEGALALVILLDQFPRNLYRSMDKAFSSDAKALDIARDAIGKGFDMALPEFDRRWFYMPFMHSEALADQKTCVKLVRARMPSDAETLKFAELHRDLIKKFGRFPHRNAILGRESTKAELAYLAQPDAFRG